MAKTKWTKTPPTERGFYWLAVSTEVLWLKTGEVYLVHVWQSKDPSDLRIVEVKTQRSKGTVKKFTQLDPNAKWSRVEKPQSPYL